MTIPTESGAMCVRLPERLYERLRRAAEAAGYQDVDKYVADLLEQMLSDDAEIVEKLRRWGYA